MKRTVDKEQYFTAPALAGRCVEFAAKLLDFDSFERLIEPSAGSGSFLALLPERRRVGLDLEPLAPGIKEADFLTWLPPLASGRVLTIGNPPFGQRAALAIAFLHRACEISDAVAFILPRSFNKYTFQNRVNPNFHLLGSLDCEDFTNIHGEARVIKTVFQVWERRSVKRELIYYPTTHPDFEMRHCHLSRIAPAKLDTLRATHEFAIAQVGADFRPKDVRSVVRGSHWFIRPNTLGVQQRFERLDFAFLDGMNTAHKSLSKKDIILAYERVVSNDADVWEGEPDGARDRLQQRRV